jgi:hypothetical protein
MNKYVFLYIVFFFAILQAKIVDVYSINELPKFLKDEDSLIVFDIDNTLMEPVQSIGSDQWFDKRIKKFRDLGCDERLAFSKTYDEWHKIQTVCDVKLVENDTKEIVDKVKKKFPVIALTTRGFQDSYNTVTQLESLGIVFSSKPYIAEEAFFKNGSQNVAFTGVLFLKGILFTNNAHKGEALFKLLDAFGKKPKSIVFINDKRSHLEQVEESTGKRSVSFIGLRYGYTDEKVKNFNSSLAELSSINFGGFIKDKEIEAFTLNK